MEHFLSPRDLAAAIAVSESSMKRWVDDGSITATRTTGGHRRIAIAEAIRFVRKTGLPVIKPELLGISGLSKVPATTSGDADVLLAAALREGRAAEVRSLLISGYLAGRDVASLCDGPLAASMHQIGELWQHGPQGIAIEHRALEICVQSLNALASLLPPPAAGAPLAIGGAPEGDPYVLPSLMVSIVLAAAGWNSSNLGADLPARALLAAAQQRPALVWLSCSVEEPLRKREREWNRTIETLVRGGAHVIIGGRALDSRRPEPIEGLKYVTSMAAVAAFAEGLTASAVPSRARRRSPASQEN